MFFQGPLREVKESREGMEKQRRIRLGRRRV
jgi:hypothetical protein